MPFFDWIFPILNHESTPTKFSLRTREERNREILIAVDEKSRKIDKNWTIVQEGINLSFNYTFFNHNSIFLCLQFASHCLHWPFLPATLKKMAVELRPVLINAKDFCSLPECNQDFVAPATMPYTLVSCGTVHFDTHPYWIDYLLLLIVEIDSSFDRYSSELPSNTKSLFDRMQIIVMPPEETLDWVETRRGCSLRYSPSPSHTHPPTPTPSRNRLWNSPNPIKNPFSYP